MPIPVLDLSGPALSRGRQHGEQMAKSIHSNIQTYRNRFLLGGATRERISAEAEKWAERFRRHDPEYFEEMQGIAEGAGVALSDIAMLNARYELSYSLYTSEAAALNTIPSHEPEGCTSFGMQPEYTTSGETLMGQNWDWLEGLLGNMCLLRVRSDEHPTYMVLTQAGIVCGMIGLNEEGIGLCVNGLSAHGDGEELHHRPFHMRVRDILRSRTLDSALKVIVSTDRVCSTNWVVGQKGGEVLNLETSSRVVHTLYPQNGLVTHGNLFISKDGIVSDFERLAPCSLYRSPRLERLIRQQGDKWDAEMAKTALKDTFGGPKAICRSASELEPEEARTVTIASVILNLDQKSMEISDGPPDRNGYACHLLM
ncbi:C45 family autoproteolytic acyltransferase/hydolase [Sneathiella chinensis]|uniref:Peptidase C45 n=1 Tax=Sneathiella chinensis TaxID=349750 RepID=A0ABQ5U3B6_9PROT|nr:C45 family peptidase [Sneathiella chinensis]GLQ06211.1 peptidase C45 [Sneathiella chinensis]